VSRKEGKLFAYATGKGTSNESRPQGGKIEVRERGKKKKKKKGDPSFQMKMEKRFGWIK